MNHANPLAFSQRLLVIVWLLLCLMAVSFCDAREPSPTRFLSFNHRTHAQEFEIDCRFCHYYADRSTQAGSPSLVDCLGCHQLIKGRNTADQLEIAKLEHLRLLNQSLEWVRTNDLPDFVFFSHQSHTNKGFECERCHGDVAGQESPGAGNITDMTMKWCVDCHTERHPLTSEGLVADASVPATPRQLESAHNFIQGSVECHFCHQ